MRLRFFPALLLSISSSSPLFDGDDATYVEVCMIERGNGGSRGVEVSCTIRVLRDRRDGPRSEERGGCEV